MGGGRKEGCLQRKWEQWPLSALFHPLPSLSVTYRKSTKGVWVYKYTSAERENRWILIFSAHIRRIAPQSFFFFFPELNPPEKKQNTTRDQNKPLPFNGDPLRVLMTGTGLCNKSKFAAIPHWRGMWCAEGQPGLCCLQRSKLWSCECVSTANHFQMELWRFMSWVIAIPTHVCRLGVPKRGRLSSEQREMPDSSGVWVLGCVW